MFHWLLIGAIVLIVIVALWAISVYNRIIRLENGIDNAWAQIDVQLKRRADLIPNLVNTVKGYAAHEKTVLENVTNARAALMNAQSPVEANAADNMLTAALGKLFAVAEAYPDLKANTNFLELQQQLADTENQISFARQYYNDAVATLNKLVVTIPWMFITGIAKVEKREFYDAPEGQQAAPSIEF